MSDSALTKQLAYEACMNIFYGEKINKHFGDRFLRCLAHLSPELLSKQLSMDTTETRL